MTRRRYVRWWEPILPAGIWLLAAKLVNLSTKALLHSPFRPLVAVFRLIRLSSRLSNIGFNVWRHRGRKWR